MFGGTLAIMPSYNTTIAFPTPTFKAAIVSP